MERAIVWNKRPSKSLTKALKRISKDSIIAAEDVETAILAAIEELKIYPEKYPEDKYKISNPGNFRAFELYKYRVSYKHTDKRAFKVLNIVFMFKLWFSNTDNVNRRNSIFTEVKQKALF